MFIGLPRRLVLIISTTLFTECKIRVMSSLCYEKRTCSCLSKFGASHRAMCHSVKCAQSQGPDGGYRSLLLDYISIEDNVTFGLGDQADTECNSVTVFKSH